MRNIFWNQDERRLRAGWRILIQIAIVSIPLSLFAYLGFYSSGELTDTIVMITALPVTIISVLFLGRYIDKREFSDYGVRLRQKRWWAEYGLGLIVGFLSACLLVYMLVLIGVAEIELSSQWLSNGKILLRAALISIITYAGIGVFEELLRVYQIRNITEGFANTRIGFVGSMLVAVFLAGLYSVIMHISSQDLLFLSFVLASGLVYGLYYLFTGRAAIAMAQHFAWDLTVSILFFLGGSTLQQPAIFLVQIEQMSGLDTSVLLPVVGIIIRCIGLACVAFWLKWSDGTLQFRREITIPSLRT